MHGLRVIYDSNESARCAVLKGDKGVLQFTTGCGVAIVAQEGNVKVESFPVIKNSHQWLDFAKRNTEAMQQLLDQKCERFEFWEWEGKPWWFTVHGLVCRDGKAWEPLPPPGYTRHVYSLEERWYESAAA